MEPITITICQLTEILDEFSEFWEGEWLCDGTLVDDNCTAAEYFIRRKRLDPCWPDRLPNIR